MHCTYGQLCLWASASHHTVSTRKKIKVKGAMPLRSVGGVLISLSVATESIGRQTTKSVTHGQYQIILLGDRAYENV